MKTEAIKIGDVIVDTKELLRYRELLVKLRESSIRVGNLHLTLEFCMMIEIFTEFAKRMDEAATDATLHDATDDAVPPPAGAPVPPVPPVASPVPPVAPPVPPDGPRGTLALGAEGSPTGSPGTVTPSSMGTPAIPVAEHTEPLQGEAKCPVLPPGAVPGAVPGAAGVTDANGDDATPTVLSESTSRALDASYNPSPATSKALDAAFRSLKAEEATVVLRCICGNTEHVSLHPEPDYDPRPECSNECWKQDGEHLTKTGFVLPKVPRHMRRDDRCFSCGRTTPLPHSPTGGPPWYRVEKILFCETCYQSAIQKVFEENP